MTHDPSTSARRRYPGRPLAIAAAGVAVLLAIGIVPRVVQRRALAAEVHSATDSVISASVATAVSAPAGPLILPATLQPLHEAVIYARSAGYVRKWYTDIGSRVTAGQLLATIEAPEVDQEVQQAQAQLKQASATLALAKSDLDRWRALARDSAVSAQELDQKIAAYEASLATANAQRANVQRLTSVQGYSRVVAPFSGVITARNVDVGTLVNPGTSGGSGSGSGSTGAGTGGQGLFRIAQSETMRLYVNVPQSLAASVRPGQAADISVPELPSRTFAGRVTRTADALDPATRTLLVEVDVPNADHALIGGSFAQVKLRTGSVTPPVVVPANALLVNATGTQVIVVDGQNVAHYRKVEVGRDYGGTVEILTGVDDGAMVVLNPSDEIVDGRAIRPVGGATPKVPSRR